MLKKNTAANFQLLLVGGQRVDWQYSLIMMLVIGGLICTPLILGSIRDRAYQVHKHEVETTNNAREILITSSGERSKAQLDNAFVARVAAAEPKAAVFGNYRLTIKAEGPRNPVEVRIASALVRSDPRIDAFDIAPVMPSGLGLRDVVVSDTVGRTLYGRQEWDAAWTSGTFTGPPLRLHYSNGYLPGDFRVVGRQKRPGEALYFSQQLGAELRAISDGLGSQELAVLPNAELVALSLPKLRTDTCVLRLPDTDVCAAQARDNLSLDLRSRQHTVQPGSLLDRFLGTQPGVSHTVTLMDAPDPLNPTAFRPVPGNCTDVVGPLLASHCPQAVVMQHVTASVVLHGQEEAGGEGTPARILGMTPEMFALLRPGIGVPADVPPGSPPAEAQPNSPRTDAPAVTPPAEAQPGSPRADVPAVMPPAEAQPGSPRADVPAVTPPAEAQPGSPRADVPAVTPPAEALPVAPRADATASAPPAPLIVPKSLEETGAIQVVAPSSAGLAVDKPFTVTVGGTTLKGRVAVIYPCEADCPIFADVESAFRLQNIADGAVVVVSTDPLRLRPKRTEVQYDEVLAYPGSVEEVLDMNQRLAALLGNDYAVSPKMIAINNLRRDNARLSAIFLVTLVFAVVFLLLSIGALSKINVDRRRRQMAQLLILGVSRWFVRLLVLCEYFLITALATLFALAVSSLLCTGLRTLLLGGYLGEIPTDASFQRVVNAMEIDPGMFGQLSGIVIGCSLLIAMLVARSASRANPIELLD